jgi:hypothetical protein
LLREHNDIGGTYGSEGRSPDHFTLYNTAFTPFDRPSRSGAFGGGLAVAERFPEFAFSTSWNFRNSKVGRVLMDEIIELGFRKWSSTTGSPKRPGNHRTDDRPGELAVESVHNVFPENTDPRFDTDSRLLGYEDEDLRRRAVALAVRERRIRGAAGSKGRVWCTRASRRRERPGRRIRRAAQGALPGEGARFSRIPRPVR